MAANPLHVLLYKTYADLKAELQRTRAGLFWWFAEPILNMVVYYIVFAVFFHNQTEHYVPFLLIGLVTWRWFQVSVMQGANSILNGKRLMVLVYVRKTLFPASVILANAYKFAITLAVLVLFLWIYGLAPSVHYAALPAILAIQLMLIMACAYIAAALLPFLPDLKLLLEHALRMIMFLSGIFYAGSSIPEALQPYFYLNPMAVLIESYRDALMYGAWPHWERLIWIAALSLMGILIGKRLIARFDYLYPKVVL